MIKAASTELQEEKILTDAIFDNVNSFFANYVRSMRSMITVEKFSTQPGYLPRSIPTLAGFKLEPKGDAGLTKTQEFQGLQTQLAVLKENFHQESRRLIYESVVLSLGRSNEKFLSQFCYVINKIARWGCNERSR